MKRWAAAAFLLVVCGCATQTGRVTPNREPWPAPPPAGEPAELVGMPASRLQANFGTPSFTRREYGSEIWRYDAGACRMFFFLYPAGREMAVRHVESVPQGKTAAADPACLTALRAKPASPSS